MNPIQHLEREINQKEGEAEAAMDSAKNQIAHATMLLGMVQDLQAELAVEKAKVEAGDAEAKAALKATLGYVPNCV